MFHCAPRTSQISSASVQSCWIECSKCVPRESSADHQKLEQCPYGQCGDEFALVVSDSLVVINDWHCELHSYTHRIAVYIYRSVSFHSDCTFFVTAECHLSFPELSGCACFLHGVKRLIWQAKQNKQTNQKKTDRKKEKESLILTSASVLLVKVWLFT